MKPEVECCEEEAALRRKVKAIQCGRRTSFSAVRLGRVDEEEEEEEEEKEGGCCCCCCMAIIKRCGGSCGTLCVLRRFPQSQSQARACD
jgi:hypothetical protein